MWVGVLKHSYCEAGDILVGLRTDDRHMRVKPNLF